LELGWPGIDCVLVDGLQELKSIEFLGIDFTLRV
jgi:hypothetical protein